MRRVDDRHAVFGDEPSHAFENVPARLRIDADGRLVEKQHLRPIEQSDGEIKPPLHAAGKRRHPPSGPFAQSRDVERLFDSTAFGFTAKTI